MNNRWDIHSMLYPDIVSTVVTPRYLQSSEYDKNNHPRTWILHRLSMRGHQVNPMDVYLRYHKKYILRKVLQVAEWLRFPQTYGVVYTWYILHNIVYTCIIWQILYLHNISMYTFQLYKLRPSRLSIMTTCAVVDSCKTSPGLTPQKTLLGRKRTYELHVKVKTYILLMEEIRRSPVEVGSLSHYSQVLFIPGDEPDFFHQQ